MGPTGRERQEKREKEREENLSDDGSVFFCFAAYICTPHTTTLETKTTLKDSAWTTGEPQGL
jgi:hypothetical protein